MSRPLHIAMVAHTLNHNNIGRVYPFLQAFAGSERVRATLIGWDETGELFPLLRDAPCPVVRLRGALAGPAAVRQLAAAFSGADVVHCFKNRAHLPSALAAAAPRGLPLVLDLDDWELGLYLEGAARWPRWRQWLWGGPMARRIGEALELERLARTAPAALLVNSGALKAHFGGEIVYTSADAALFDPAASDGAGFRAAHGLPADAPVIGFLGTPHPHKGIDELLAAFETVRAAAPAARLLFVGVPAHNPYRQRLLAAEGVAVVGYVAAGDYPAAYAACDVLAIPQRAVTEGIMQTPAKLILAMAAGRAIVAAGVGDMPAILGDAGVFVPPENAGALAGAIAALLADPARRATLGAAARERFLSQWTLAHVARQVEAIYRRLAA